MSLAQDRQTRQVQVRAMRGPKHGIVELDPDWFGVTPNMAVLHQVVNSQMAGARAGTHSTLRRSEVRGGGRKPWRQKGTGRARQGSIRATQWVGGGIPMGPKPRDYSQGTPKKMIKLGLASALSDRAEAKRVMVIQEWGFERPSTKAAIAFLKRFKLRGNVLIVLSDSDADYMAYKSFANLPTVGLVPSGELTAWDVLRSDWVVFTTESLPGSQAYHDQSASLKESPGPDRDIQDADTQQVAPATEQDSALTDTPEEDHSSVEDSPTDVNKSENGE